MLCDCGVVGNLVVWMKDDCVVCGQVGDDFGFKVVVLFGFYRLFVGDVVFYYKDGLV